MSESFYQDFAQLSPALSVNSGVHLNTEENWQQYDSARNLTWQRYSKSTDFLGSFVQNVDFKESNHALDKTALKVLITSTGDFFKLSDF